MQAAVVEETVISIAEHHIIGIALIQPVIPCGRYTFVILCEHFRDERIALIQIVLIEFKREIISVIDHNHMNVVKIDSSLSAKSIKQIFAHTPRLFVMRNNNVKRHARSPLSGSWRL